MIGLGLGVLCLSPEAFWAMTPREFAAILRTRGGRRAASVLSRGGFDALMARFPDGKGDQVG